MDEKQLQQAAEGFERRLATVAPDGWNAATPCTEWDVRALVNHVVNELRWIPPLLDGLTIAEVGDRFDGDLLGADPVAAYRSAMNDAVSAAAQPGAGERAVHLSFGDFPGSEYLSQIVSDLTIHTWDLARGAGADDRLDEDLVDAVTAYLAPQAEAWRSGGAFGPLVDVPDGADAQTKLLAVTGRRC